MKKTPKILFRLLESARFRINRVRGVAAANPASLTFCIAHFNGADFLEITLHAIRRYYPDARIIVADARSAVPQLEAALTACERFQAETHILLARHNHTGLLDYMFRQINSGTAVFLDQDCVLLESLHPLLEKLTPDIWLAGPRDEMWINHPKTCVRYPQLKNRPLRAYPQYIHASLMAVNVAELRNWMIGCQPFKWETAWGTHPHERYHGIIERIRRKSPRSILPLDSRHTGYGLGTIYLHAGRPVAYHNWFSSQVYGQAGKMDDVVEVEWLRTEMKRFLDDYWNNKVDFELASTVHEVGGEANR